MAEGKLEKKLSVTAPKVRELLGRPRFQPDLKRRTREPGVATGLAWTPVGGDVLFVEATAMPGNPAHPPRLIVTGQLGDVMRESAQAALSYVRGHARDFAPSSPTTASPPTTSTSTCRRARSRRTGRARASRWRPR